MKLAPHFAMEMHLHLATAYPCEPWVEHFEWLKPMFNERLQIKDGRMFVSNRPDFGFSLSGQVTASTQDTFEVGKRSGSRRRTRCWPNCRRQKQPGCRSKGKS